MAAANASKSGSSAQGNTRMRSRGIRLLRRDVVCGVLRRREYQIGAAQRATPQSGQRLPHFDAVRDDNRFHAWRRDAHRLHDGREIRVTGHHKLRVASRAPRMAVAAKRPLARSLPVKTNSRPATDMR